MDRAGEVVRIAGGVLVVRSPDDGHPAIGDEVVDESLSTVGEVVDVFGPVSRPYVAVSPAEGTRAASLLGERLYAR